MIDTSNLIAIHYLRDLFSGQKKETLRAVMIR